MDECNRGGRWVKLFDVFLLVSKFKEANGSYDMIGPVENGFGNQC